MNGITEQSVDRPAIEAREFINLTELRMSSGVVLYRPEVRIMHGKPVATYGDIAGVWVADGDGPGLGKAISVLYHYGRKAWHLAIEHSAQKATEYHRFSLGEAIQELERQAGVTLPLIKVIEYGVGIYPAKDRNGLENPWALKDGRFYEVCHPQRGPRRFVVDVRNGTTRISFFDRSTGDVDSTETYDPHFLFTLEEWQSLHEID